MEKSDKNIKKNNTPKKNKKSLCNVKKMGIDIDKNEYFEIVLSNSAHPENRF